MIQPNTTVWEMPIHKLKYLYHVIIKYILFKFHNKVNKVNLKQKQLRHNQSIQFSNLLIVYHLYKAIKEKNVNPDIWFNFEINLSKSSRTDECITINKIISNFESK